MTDSMFEAGKRYGSSDQLFGITPYRRIDGKAQNVLCVDLYNKKGLQLTVVPDRGMDILALKYRGNNISYLSKTGLVGPQFFVENGGQGFMKNFFVGFLTTGGLSYMGAADEEHGLHGTISNTPASHVSFDQNETELVVSGDVKEAEVFGSHLVIHRRISVEIETASIHIKDTVQNLGYIENNLMLLYHMNFGYPFMSPNLKIELPEAQTFDRKGNELDHMDPAFRQISDPIDTGTERVVFHKLTGNGRVIYQLKNKNLGIGLQVSFSRDQLPYLNEWQSFVSGDYVLGLEPGTNNVNGLREAERHGELQKIKPGEIKHFAIDIQLSDMEVI